MNSSLLAQNGLDVFEELPLETQLKIWNQIESFPYDLGWHTPLERKPFNGFLEGITEKVNSVKYVTADFGVGLPQWNYEDLLDPHNRKGTWEFFFDKKNRMIGDSICQYGIDEKTRGFYKCYEYKRRKLKRFKSRTKTKKYKHKRCKTTVTTKGKFGEIEVEVFEKIKDTIVVYLQEGDESPKLKNIFKYNSNGTLSYSIHYKKEGSIENFYIYNEREQLTSWRKIVSKSFPNGQVFNEDIDYIRKLHSHGGVAHYTAKEKNQEMAFDDYKKVYSFGRDEKGRFMIIIFSTQKMPREGAEDRQRKEIFIFDENYNWIFKSKKRIDADYFDWVSARIIDYRE